MLTHNYIFQNYLLVVYNDWIYLVNLSSGKQQLCFLFMINNSHYERDMPVFIWDKFWGVMYNVATGEHSGEYHIVLIDITSGKTVHRITCWRYTGRSSRATHCFDPHVKAEEGVLIAFPNPKNQFHCIIEGGMSIFCLKLSTSSTSSMPVFQHANIYIEVYLGLLLASKQDSSDQTDIVSDSIVSTLARKVGQNCSQLRVTDFSISYIHGKSVLLNKIEYNLIQPFTMEHTLAFSVDLEKAFTLMEPCRTFAATNIPKSYSLGSQANSMSVWPFWFLDGQEHLNCGVLDIDRLKQHPYSGRIHTFSPPFKIQELVESQPGKDLMSKEDKQ